MLGLVSHARRDRRSRIRGERPRRGRNDQRHRKNHPEDAFVYMLLKRHDSPPGVLPVTVEGKSGGDV